MSSDLAKIFGQKIRQVREQKRYSQEYLAELANLNRSYIGEIERGAVEPSLATMEKLAIALNHQLSAILLECESSSSG